MQCEHCGNENATIQFTKVEKDDVHVLHLCESCAAEQGIAPTPTPASAPLVDFLAQIGKGVEDAPALGGCPTCGLTATQLKQVGRLGCADCYGHFEQHLRALLRRLHGGTQHVGKAAAAEGAPAPDPRGRVESLRRSLRRAVESEDFEHAAVLRDQIRRLESPGEETDRD